MTRKFTPGEIVLVESPLTKKLWEGSVVEQVEGTNKTYRVQRFDNQFTYLVYTNEMM